MIASRADAARSGMSMARIGGRRIASRRAYPPFPRTRRWKRREEAPASREPSPAGGHDPRTRPGWPGAPRPIPSRIARLLGITRRSGTRRGPLPGARDTRSGAPVRLARRSSRAPDRLTQPLIARPDPQPTRAAHQTIRTSTGPEPSLPSCATHARPAAGSTSRPGTASLLRSGRDSFDRRAAPDHPAPPPDRADETIGPADRPPDRVD